mgnify:CR=1 FL=1
MDTPAKKMLRVLSGFLITITTVVSIGIIENGGEVRGSKILLTSALGLLSGVLLLILMAGGSSRLHGTWPTDNWFSREGALEMQSRLEGERDEASMQDLGSKWARMEMKHLESKHSEE